MAVPLCWPLLPVGVALPGEGLESAGVDLVGFAAVEGKGQRVLCDLSPWILFPRWRARHNGASALEKK